MTAQSPSAYALSVALHATVVALVLWLFYQSARRDDTRPIFEVVAGEGNNYEALEAPALGEPGGKAPEVSLPTPPVPVTPAPQPEAPAPVPVAPAPPPPAPTAAPAPKAVKAPAELPPPNFAKDVKRLSEKRAANIERKFRADQKAAEEKARKEAERQAKTMSKAEFDRLNQGRPAPTAKAPAGAPKVPSVSQGIRGGVAGGSTANTKGGAGGKAMNRAEMDAMDAYIAMLIRRIRSAMERANFSDQLAVRIQFTITDSGSVVGVGLLETSGSPEFDRAVIDAFREVRDLGPPPHRLEDTFQITLRVSDRSE
jgi:colicin import membrane protein